MISDHITCAVCGGMTRCWCPTPAPTNAGGEKDILAPTREERDWYRAQYHLANDRAAERASQIAQLTTERDELTRCLEATEARVIDWQRKAYAEGEHIAQLTRERDSLLLCRDDVYLLAHRIRLNSSAPDLIGHIIRICEERGASLSPFRSTRPIPPGGTRDG